MSVPGDKAPKIFTLPDLGDDLDSRYNTLIAKDKEKSQECAKAGGKRVLSVDAETAMPEPKTPRLHEQATSSRLYTASPVNREGSLISGLSSFQEAELFSGSCSDCGKTGIDAAGFERLNTKAYPDYGSALYILFEAADQHVFNNDYELEDLFYEALIERKYSDVRARAMAGQLSTALYGLSEDVTPGTVDAAVRKVCQESAEELIQDVRLLFYKKGYMHCILNESDGSETENESVASSDEYYGSSSDAD